MAIKKFSSLTVDQAEALIRKIIREEKAVQGTGPVNVTNPGVPFVPAATNVYTSTAADPVYNPDGSLNYVTANMLLLDRSLWPLYARGRTEEEIRVAAKDPAQCDVPHRKPQFWNK